jgi:hypothetical protein
MEKTYNLPVEGMDFFFILNLLLQIATVAFYISIPILLYKIYKILKNKDNPENRNY